MGIFGFSFVHVDLLPKGFFKIKIFIGTNSIMIVVGVLKLLF